MEFGVIVIRPVFSAPGSSVPQSQLPLLSRRADLKPHRVFPDLQATHRYIAAAEPHFTFLLQTESLAIDDGHGLPRLPKDGFQRQCRWFVL